MDGQALRARIESEMADAEDSRRRGNEGRARVCARRAVGLAGAAYLAQRAARPSTSSAYEMLKRLQQEQTLAPALRQAAFRLSTRVRPSGHYPYSEDPLADAREIVDALLVAIEEDIG